jgi:hypothetical protein
MAKDPEEDVQDQQVKDESAEQPKDDAPLTTEEPESEVDWSVRGPELAAQVAKLINDQRSSDGQRRRNQDRDEDIRRLGDVVSAQSKTLSQVMGHLAKDDPEAKAEWDKTQETSRQEEVGRSLESRRDHIMEDIVEIVKNGESLKISADDSQRIQSLWTAAQSETQRTGDISHLYEVKIEAQRAVQEFERKQAAAELRKARDDAKANTKKAMEKAGVFDQDTGPAGGGGSENLSTQEKMSRAISAGTSRIKI